VVHAWFPGYRPAVNAGSNYYDVSPLQVADARRSLISGPPIRKPGISKTRADSKNIGRIGSHLSLPARGRTSPETSGEGHAPSQGRHAATCCQAGPHIRERSAISARLRKARAHREGFVCLTEGERFAVAAHVSSSTAIRGSRPRKPNPSPPTARDSTSEIACKQLTVM
jgi:hypothetical protein